MKKVILSQNYYSDEISRTLIQRIEKNIGQMDSAVLYYDFPFAQDATGVTILSNVMIVSPLYGVLLPRICGKNKIGKHKWKYLRCAVSILIRQHNLVEIWS